MIGFLQTTSGSMVSVAMIRRIGIERTNAEGERFHDVLVETDDGSSAQNVCAYLVEAFIRRPVQLIPAEPGTSIIWVDGTDKRPGPYRSGVIAWALCCDGQIRPVAPNGVNDGQSGATYVELPNGAIDGVGEFTDPCGFKDAEAMLNHWVGEEADSHGSF